MELCKEHFPCYETLPTLVERREQSAEAIIPDYCPDIARIVESSGNLYLRSCELNEGRVSISGTLRVSLLYIGEGSSGLRSYEYTLPVEEKLEGRVLDEKCEVRIDGCILDLALRTVNPRKLSLHAVIELRATPYCPETLTLCSGIADGGKFGIQTLECMQDLCCIERIEEKDFVFSEELAISAAREPIGELLSTRCCPRVTETRVMGSKLLLKGLIFVEALYLGEGGGLETLNAELPFSQLMDASTQEGSDYSAETFLRLTGAECRSGSEGGGEKSRTLTIKLFLHAFALLRRNCSVNCLVDLYSISHELTAETKTQEVFSAPQFITQEETVRELIETGVEVASVLRCDLRFVNADMVQEGESALVRATAEASILYLDEGGAPLSVERRCEVSSKLELPPRSTASAPELTAREVSAIPTASGIELRFTYQIKLETNSAQHVAALESITASAREEREGEAPSLILRRLAAKPKLWDIAKEYRTTMQDILSANELSGEQDLRAGELLLIPRKR